MNTNTIREYKEKLKLTKTQREVLVGLLLGDGHLETQDNGKTYRLKVEHGILQKEYVDTLYKIFKPWCSHGPMKRIRRTKYGIVTSYGFYTYSSGTLRFYAQQFYPEKGKRVIPILIRKLLTPQAIAIWFMDNGSKKSKIHSTYIFHTHAFTKRELQVVCNILKEKFGIEMHIHRQYAVYRLYVMAKSAQKFRDLIEAYMVPSMRYKLENRKPKE